MNVVPRQTESPWPHRLALMLVCATFPLIWMGGLVTTTGAGMAVPDWPNTYGYNLFLYPWQTWVFGPWDLFVEHAHRLLGSLVGILTIALSIVVWRRRRTPSTQAPFTQAQLTWIQPTWMRMVVVMALGLVLVQGVLGGMRVLAVDPRLAMVHGCVGPAFFGVCTAMAIFLSPLWQSDVPRTRDDSASKLHRLSLITLTLSYVQIALGAQIRHVLPMASSGSFRAAVLLHLFIAIVLTGHIASLCWHVFRRYRSIASLRRPATALALLIGVQLGLGAATWVVKFGWPTWINEYRWNAGFVVSAESWLQTNVVTAHVATGSLILATSVVLALRGLRLVHGSPKSERGFSSVRIGVFA